MDLYNLYIIAADMQEENTGDHTFDFDQYFADVPAEEGNVFAWILDMEDFYEKGPSYAGQDETYRIAQAAARRLLRVNRRARGRWRHGRDFRFAHAETIMPFAALIGAPGSTQQARPWSNRSPSTMCTTTTTSGAARPSPRWPPTSSGMWPPGTASIRRPARPTPR